VNAKEHLGKLYPQGRPFFGITIDHIQAILDDGSRQGMLEAAELIPDTWIDSLLTGPGGMGEMPWKCPEVESLLRGVEKRIREHAAKLFPKA
jgi:hypothetical protein